MKFISLCLSPLLLCQVIIAKPLSEIEWHDSDFKACVMQQAAQQGWTDSTEFSELKCHSSNIHSPVAIRYFTELRKLSFYNNNIAELDVRTLAHLESLNVASNQLKILRLEGLGELTELYAFRNALSTIDLTGLTKLKKMRLMQNQLKKLDIAPLVALQEGHIFDNQLTTLSIVGLKQLKFLDVRQNPMPDELYDEFDLQVGVTISHDGNADDWK